MNRKPRLLCKVFNFLLSLVMAAMMLPIVSMGSYAATVTKTEKSNDIAVVFDNSGSMYRSMGWCRAKYAMEIFASMLDYSRDKLTVFPMWEVATDGSQPSSGGSYSAIEIRSKQDIDKISNLYTVRPSNTPFAPVTEAHEYLNASAADEKWLIVLTDGAFNEDARGRSASIDLAARLQALATNGIRVQYMGFDGAEELPANEAQNFFSKKTTDTSLKDDLIGICNSIFQRSVLPANRLSGEKLSLDLSMKKIIVFAQGANTSIGSLRDAGGNEVPVSLDSGQRKYSQIKARGYSDAPVDTALAGQVVAFAPCPKGEYTLTYSGADAIQIFYEPDVDIDVSITDSNGDPVTGGNDLPAGDYTVTSRIVDSSTGEDVTGHELMGSNVTLKTLVKSSAEGEFKEYANGDTISLAPDNKTEIRIEGQYLDKYKISSADDARLAWMKQVKILPPAIPLAVQAEVMQPQSWYKSGDRDTWKPVKFHITMDGKPLTDEQLARTTLKLTASPDLATRCQPAAGESAFMVYIAQDGDGKATDFETGRYTLQAAATYTDEYGNETTADGSADFEIQRYSKFWRWLFWLLIALVILIIALAILNHPVMPSAIYLLTKRSCHAVKVNGESVDLSADLYPGELICKAKPCTPLKNRGKTTAEFEVRDIVSPLRVDWFEVDGQRFRRVGDKYVNDENETIAQMKPKVRISDYTQLKWSKNQRARTGQIFINHND